MYFCVLKYKMTQWPITSHFFTKSSFNIVLICTANTVYKYKIAQLCHNANSIHISTGVFLLCEGYTELTPSVAIFCNNMVAENKSRSI
jgi:hypothetical protein